MIEIQEVEEDPAEMDQLELFQSKSEPKPTKFNALFTFDRFIDRIQNRKIHDLKIAENFDEFLGSNVEDESVSIEETSELLDTYIEAVETELDKDRLKLSMRNLMTEAQAIETV